jgi:hypothetical protein
MFVLIREVHAYCGLILLLFTVMYAATGYPLVHETEFNLEADAVVSTVSLDFAGDPDGDALYDYVASTFGVRGQRRPVEVLENGGRNLFFTRPGWTVRFEVAPDLRSAQVFTREGSLFQKTVQLHRIKGFSGGPAFIVWGLMVDLVSLAMLVFVVTGIYLWWVRSKDRRFGWAMLALSWGLTTGTFAYLFMAR